MKCEINIIQHFAGLEDLVPEWWVLWRKISGSTVFQTPAWILPFWQIFAPGRLCSIAIRFNERLAGLAPLYLESSECGARLLPIGLGLSDHCDLLLDPELAEVAAARMAEALAAIDEWDICEFAELHPAACALQVPVPRESSNEFRDGSVAPVLEFRMGTNTLWDAIPGKKRQNIRHAQAEAAKRGTLLINAATAQNAREAFSDLIRLHNARWISRGEPGIFADPRVERFHSLALPQLFAQDLARIYRLTIYDSVTAVYYGFFDRGRAFAYSTGFDAAFAECSPGALVVAHAIEQAIHGGARQFHFLRGNERYKITWGAVPRKNQTRLFARGALRNG